MVCARLKVFQYFSDVVELAEGQIVKCRRQASKHCYTPVATHIGICTAAVAERYGLDPYVSNFAVMTNAEKYQHTSTRLHVVTNQPLF